MEEKYYCEIRDRFKDKVSFNVSAKELTSYKTGGVIDVVFYPTSLDDIVEMLDFLKTCNIDYFICGKGTNILVSDYGFDGVFLKTDRINSLKIIDNIIVAEAGCLLDDMVSKACERSLAGLERLSYIPGSVGGGIRMNAGAFGSEVFDKLEYIEAVNLLDLSFVRLYKKDLRYGYRYVEGIERYFIVSGVFICDYGERERLEAIRCEIINKRSKNQPLELPSAGSVFKRPPGDYASRLIELCGLKGIRIGDAMISQKHAGFIVNMGKATSSDIYRLINYVRNEVYKKTGVLLELEQILVGRF